MHFNECVLKKGQKTPIIKAIIVQYNIITTKNQFVNIFLKFFETFFEKMYNMIFLIYKKEVGFIPNLLHNFMNPIYVLL